MTCTNTKTRVPGHLPSLSVPLSGPPLSTSRAGFILQRDTLLVRILGKRRKSKKVHIGLLPKRMRQNLLLASALHEALSCTLLDSQKRCQDVVSAQSIWAQSEENVRSNK